MSDDLKDVAHLSEVMYSAHAPGTKGGLRLNIAAVDDHYRKESIEHIIDYVERARQFPKVRMINVHFSPRQWSDATQTRGKQGTYDRLVDGFRQIGRHCAKHGLEMVLENNNSYYVGIPDAEEAHKFDWTYRNACFGNSPDEWIQAALDINLSNVGLCLDSSHACTYSHMFPAEQRKDKILEFVKRPDLIRHVHWNDNYLYDPKGRVDNHTVLNNGTTPIELHRTIKSLDAWLLIEHFYSIEELEGELEFINSL
ncbi:MAG: TIM barrel protein [SAR202 cluster bacterium]|nr:TIM barrel protein [SAR202 cluster bacterium]